MWFSLLCFLSVFSFSAASHVKFSNPFVYTGSSVKAGRHFVAVDLGLNARKLSYDNAPLSLAYAFGFNKFDIGLSASYALLQAYQVSLVSKYHFFSRNNFNLGVTGAVGALGAGMAVAPLVQAFFVGSGRWSSYEAALDLGFSPSLGKKKRPSHYRGADREHKRKRGGKRSSRWWLSSIHVGTSHTYHWASDFSTTLSVHTNAKARFFALNVQARLLF